MLAKEAPICSGRLFNNFGYVANTPASRAVLESTNQALPNSDISTRELFDEIVAIRRIIPKDSAPITITSEQWKRYWAIINEETSSLESGFHFGHYIVGCNSDIVAHYHAARVLVVLAHTIHLERWFSKLRAVLLMEADFNASNKIVYSVRMMKNVRNHHLMSDEIFSKKMHGRQWNTNKDSFLRCDAPGQGTCGNRLH